MNVKITTKISLNCKCLALPGFYITVLLDEDALTEPIGK